jgi:hypothetical protein
MITLKKRKDDLITTITAFLNKYKKQKDETQIYKEYKILREIAEDLEEIKDMLQRIEA